MIIQGAFINLSKSISPADFLAAVSGNVRHAGCYRVDPPPGITMTAAIDWRLILHEPADVASLSVALWDVYESTISCLARDCSGPPPGLLIQIRSRGGGSDQFVVGRDILEREILIHRMKESVRALTPKKHVETVRQEVSETEESGFWEKLPL